MEQVRLERSGLYFVKEGQKTRPSFLSYTWNGDQCDGFENDVSKGLLSISRAYVMKVFACIVVERVENDPEVVKPEDIALTLAKPEYVLGGLTPNGEHRDKEKKFRIRA